MSDIALTLDSLNSKIEKLVHLHRKAEEDQVRLAKKNEELRTKLEQQMSAYDELNKKYKAMRLAMNMSGASEEGRAESKRKITELVREIDKCIALLNR